MADTETTIQVEQPTEHQNQTPLLNKQQDQTHEENDQEKNNHLQEALERLDVYLTILGLKQSKALSFLLSWLAFLFVGVAVPVIMLELSNSCPGCERAQVKSFEIDIVASQACLAAASLLCLSHNLRKYGVRKFMFVDRHSGHMERFSNQYVDKIKNSVRLLALWLLPCLVLKLIREVIRLLYVHHASIWHSVAILFAFVVSWTYTTIVFLSACILFYLVCNLQIIHFDDYVKLMETEPDVLVLIQEHARLRYYLSKISHRFRIFLLLEFLVVTVSQFVTLFQTTGYSGILTFINGGDFAVSSIVQVLGIALCLNASAKISHRAQGISSLASRWHAYLTCSSSDISQLRASDSHTNFEAPYIDMNNSESDLDSMDFTAIPTYSQLASYMSSYHRRQSLVMYLQNNPGGITIFGYTVDRGMINTIFVIELSLVLFVLGKTIVFTTT